MTKKRRYDEIKPVKVHIKTFWEGGVKTTSLMRDFEVVADAPKWKYGTNSAPAPGELFLTSIGACFTGTFAKCAQEMNVILDDLTTDIKGEIDHEMNGKERIKRIVLELSAFAKMRYKGDLDSCFKEARRRCPLTNAVNCPINISLKFNQVEK